MKRALQIVGGVVLVALVIAIGMVACGVFRILAAFFADFGYIT